VRGGASAAIRNPAFVRLWLAQTISNFGDWLDVPAIYAIVVFTWGKGAAGAGLITGMMSLPWFLLGPVCGVFADRVDRRKAMIACDLMRAVAAVTVAYASNLTQLAALQLIKGMGGVLFAPCRAAYLRSVVPREDLLAANSLSSTSDNVMKIVAPLVGGILLAILRDQIQIVFYINAFTYLVSALLLGMSRSRDVRTETNVTIGSVRSSNMMSDLRAGFRCLGSSPLLVSLLTFRILSSFFAGAHGAIRDVFLRDYYGMPELIGYISAASAAGFGLAAVVGVFWAPRLRPLRLVTLAPLAAAFGVVRFIAGMRGWHWGFVVAASVPSMLFLGAAFLGSTTLLQEEVPGHLLGRVWGTLNGLVNTSRLAGIGAAAALAAGTAAGPLGLAANLTEALLVGVLCFIALPRLSKAGRPAAPRPAGVSLS